jgi:hypothetical protein
MCISLKIVFSVWLTCVENLLVSVFNMWTPTLTLGKLFRKSYKTNVHTISRRIIVYIFLFCILFANKCIVGRSTRRVCHVQFPCQPFYNSVGDWVEMHTCMSMRVGYGTSRIVSNCVWPAVIHACLLSHHIGSGQVCMKPCLPAWSTKWQIGLPLHFVIGPRPCTHIYRTSRTCTNHVQRARFTATHTSIPTQSIPHPQNYILDWDTILICAPLLMNWPQLASHTHHTDTSQMCTAECLFSDVQM